MEIKVWGSFCKLLLLAAWVLFAIHSAYAKERTATPGNPKVYSLAAKLRPYLGNYQLLCFFDSVKQKVLFGKVRKGDLRDKKFSLIPLKRTEIQRTLQSKRKSQNRAPSSGKRREIQFLESQLAKCNECLTWSGPGEETPTPTPDSEATPPPTATPDGGLSGGTPFPTPPPAATGVPVGSGRAPTTVVTSLTHEEITLNFDRPVTIAYYANGEPAALQPFIISSVSPAPIDQSVMGQSGRLTPANGFPYGCIQDEGFWTANCNEFDRTQWDAKCGPVSSACYYDRRRNLSLLDPVPEQIQSVTSRAGGQPGLGVVYPRLFNSQVIQSLVLTKSVADTRECTPLGTAVSGYLDFRGACNWSAVKTAFVLTIVPSADELPYVDELRPPYPRMVPAGSAKPRFFLRNADPSYISINLPTSPLLGEYTGVLRGIEKTWLVDAAAEGYTRVAPNQNMRSYGTAVSMDLGEAMMLLVSNNINLIQKIELAKHISQIGMDAFYALEAGKAYVPGWAGFVGANGHAGYGLVSAIVYAGAALQVPAMRNVVLSGNNKNYFRKTCGPIYDAPANPLFLGINNFPRYNSNFPCTSWPTGNWDRNTYNNYFFCCGPSAWLGEFLALRLLGLESAFANSALFDLLDRLYTEGYVSGAHRSIGAMESWGTLSNYPNLCANGTQNKCHPGWCNSLSSTPYTPAESAIDSGPACS